MDGNAIPIIHNTTTAKMGQVGFTRLSISLLTDTVSARKVCQTLVLRSIPDGWGKPDI